jgi:hypothetical protein
VPYAAWLVWKLGKYLHQVRVAQRINTLMVLALSFIIWFGVIPLIRLW